MKLDKMTREELQQLKTEVEQAIASKAHEEKKLALAEAEKVAAQFGYSLAELTGAEVKRKGRVAAGTVVKFRNPANPQQTWSGRGRRPEWIKDLDAEGRMEAARV